MAKRTSENTVVVIGLGRFGATLALTLMDLDREVLAIEKDPALVRQYAASLTLVVEADATDIETLRSLGVSEAGNAVVAIGTSIEASLLATSALSELGVDTIWAKAVTEPHRRILEKVGAHQVIFPELDMGNRVAHRLVRGGVRDYIDFGNGYAMTLVDCAKDFVGLTLAKTKLVSLWDVAVVGVQHKGEEAFEVPSGSTLLREGDRLVVAGRKDNVDRFMLGKPPQGADPVRRFGRKP